MVKKAHFVTGKGGVGKSLISAVLARYLSQNSPLDTNRKQEKEKILLAELNEQSFFKDFLGLKRISYKPLPWLEGIDISQWSPQECLREYALYLLKLESLYKLFFENPVSKSLIQVAPGLEELALLGKITSSPRSHGPPMNYDQLVIDSFATGHFISLFRAPAAMAEAVQFGPMGEQSRGIDRWLRDKDFTHLHIVTIAEELPVTETIELYKTLKKEFGLIATVYLNKLTRLTSADLKNLNPELTESLEYIIDNEKEAKKNLKDAQIEYIELPLVNSLEPSELIDHLAQEMKKAEAAID
ncbi:MAG: arsenical pump-driving ATPase [Bdellovibrionaceae bacterium]|nr:arsenical pump-driving ATPase [Bdellovibrio sp.]